MKKIKTLAGKHFFALSIIVFVTACKSTNSPKAVTETFLVSVARLDIPTAKNYSTRQTWSFLKVLEKEAAGFTDEQKEAFLKDFSVKIISEQQLNDTTYLVTFETKPELLPFKQLNLLAEKNLEGNIKWKVDFNSFEFIQSDSTIQEVMLPGEEPQEPVTTE
jgi:hypothetical protein